MATDNAVTEENFGAWVLKCNPVIWDLQGFVADGHRLIDSWSVVENYRSAMMRHGQRVLLWVTGPERGPLPRGFWCSGWVTNTIEAEAEPGSSDDGSDVRSAAAQGSTDASEDEDYWLDPEARARVTFSGSACPHRLGSAHRGDRRSRRG